MSRYESNADVYYLFGEPYHIVNSNLSNVVVDSIAKTISIPNETALFNYEKQVLLDALESLKIAYLNNPYIDINHITFKVSRMKSRYGSCKPSTGKIHINQKLIHMPKHYLDYVFCHEITHLKVHNHSTDFYTLLKKICPNYQSIRQALKQG
jgi:predicted metal-dependent hydrolase